MNKKMFNIKFFIMNIIFISFFACDATLEKINTKIIILSDPHYYSSELGAEGAAFEKHVQKYNSFVLESKAINEEAINQIKEDDSEIVIIPGDMVKDGEKINHLEFSEKLQELEAAGKKVYVISGNHDINNPQAFEYYDDVEIPIDTIDAEEFADIYNDFGFAEAIDRDSDSLSYIVEPIDGLWIMAIDSCIYDNNLIQEHSTIGGRLKQATRKWIKEKLEEAKEQNKIVACFMHHAIIQHFSIEEKITPDFIIEDYESISKLLSDGGVKVVFTGHSHAQDIVKKSYGLNVIYDIQTSSLVSFPCAYRKIEVIQGRKLVITSKRIEKIDYDTGNIPFQEYAYNNAYNGASRNFGYLLAGLLVESGMSQEEAIIKAEEILEREMFFGTTVREMMARALLEHRDGKEVLSPKVGTIITQMLASKEKTIQLIGGLLLSLLTDFTPIDNDAIINL